MNHHLPKEKLMWLVGKKVLRRDDIKQVIDLSYSPRVKADILTKFIKKTNFENGDYFTTYLDGVIQLDPMEHNLFCKILALRWVLCDSKPLVFDLERLDYFRLNNFYEKRLGVSLYLFPKFIPNTYPFPNLTNIAMEKEGLSSPDFLEYLEALAPFQKIMEIEEEKMGRLGLISAVFKWRDMQDERILGDLDTSRARACVSCGKNAWKLRARKFGVYLKCLTRNCRGVQEVKLPSPFPCKACGGKVSEMIGQGGTRVYVCDAYPGCDYVFTR